MQDRDLHIAKIGRYSVLSHHDRRR